jgi:exopolysaccharide production protein ExoQ
MIFVWLILLLILLYKDPAKDPAASWALWIPVTWLFFMGSRLPAQWLDFYDMQDFSASGALEEGNGLDRTVYVILLLLAVRVVSARSVRWGRLLAGNTALALFLAFALASVAWSDSPGVAFKRWIRDLGNYLSVLVILSDPRPLQAIETVLRRVCYLLIPLSWLLIKYYPATGRGYDSWIGTTYYLGVSTTKNGLGILCLVSGIFLFWDTARRWSRRREGQTRRVIFVNLAFMGMTLWLLNLSSSATSRLCLLVGCLVIAASRSRLFRTNPGRLKVAIPAAACLYLVLEFFFGIQDLVTGALGRDPTLTGRTDVWEAVMAFKTNPLLGTGYESFWLGDRLHRLWVLHPWRPTQAHNGFLEVYLNLGLVGLTLLGIFFVASYLRIWRIWRMTSIDFVSLSLAMWIVMLLYNVTEAAFKGNVLWSMFLLGSIVVPGSNLGESFGRMKQSRDATGPAEP